MHTADQVAAPRNYVMQSDGQVVFYNGLPVNPAGDYPAHRAEALSAHWDELTEKLEGVYFVARATDDPPRLELQTDILGFDQVYYFHQGDLWLVSNSVRLIERISGSSALDPLGASLFLAIKWVGADCTLRSDIRVIPGGQRWTWRKGDIERRRQSYYPPSKLARQLRQALTPSYVKQLADDLIQPLRSIGQSFDDITCAMSGGRDSRLMVALVIQAGIPARYYTYGDPSGTNAEIARRIAQTFDLPYEVVRTTTSDVIENWDKACWLHVRQSDGMSPLQFIAGTTAFLTPQIDRLDIRLWGVGGEIARAPYSGMYKPGSPLFLTRHDVAGVQRYLAEQRIKNHGGLVRQEAVELARDYIHRFVTQRADDGFAPLDIPDVFYAYQHVGRRGGSNMRRSMAIRDVFSPYCTRPFIEAAFAMPALQRYTQPLHYNVMRLLSPEMHRLPFNPVGTGPWPLQQPVMNLLKSYGTAQLRRISRRISRLFKRDKVAPEHIVRDNMFDRWGWFEAKREQVREICLDQSDSPLWSFVDRSMFDRITSSATDPVKRSHYMKALYHIATLFYYEADRRHAAPTTAQR
jgi:asparagine synthase (glutamine-hydrolysing)